MESTQRHVLRGQLSLNVCARPDYDVCGILGATRDSLNAVAVITVPEGPSHAVTGAGSDAVKAQLARAALQAALARYIACVRPLTGVI